MRFIDGALAAALAVCPLQAQWTIGDVVRRAGGQYAGVQVSLEHAATAAAAVQQARTAFLPRGDLYAQLNRATRNNVFGMTLPNPVIPAISGPPQTVNAGTNVWGSAAGFLIEWEPFDLGQRGAKVATSDAARHRAERAYARTRFEVEASAADAFLTVLAADQTVAAAQAQLIQAAPAAIAWRPRFNTQTALFARGSGDAARRIAATTPVQFAAARASHAQARARYQAGLAGIAEVSDAQRLLLQSEVDQSLARLNIWRAQLTRATAAGDLRPFLELTR